MKQKEKQDPQEMPSLAKDTTNAPFWVSWPLRLTVQEIKAPQPVIDNFFRLYTLAEIRMLLQDWLLETLKQNKEASGYVWLCNDVERFIEAVFMVQHNALSEQVGEMVKEKE